MNFILKKIVFQLVNKPNLHLKNVPLFNEACYIWDRYRRQNPICHIFSALFYNIREENSQYKNNLLHEAHKRRFIFVTVVKKMKNGRRWRAERKYKQKAFVVRNEEKLKTSLLLDYSPISFQYAFFKVEGYKSYEKCISGFIVVSLGKLSTEKM